MSTDQGKSDAAGWRHELGAPWAQEPDSKRWGYRGFTCMAKRHVEMGHWCGYVAVPVGHPFYGMDYESDPLQGIEVHGGLTFSGYDAFPGDEPEDAYWIGFDCAHCMDLVPGVAISGHEYRDLRFVEGECESVVNQLIQMVPQ